MDNLITLDEYKTYKGIAKTDEDARLQILINTASSLIQTYIGRKFIDDGNDIQEIFNLDYDSEILYLDRYPINSVTSVTEIDPYGYDSTVHFPVPDSSYYVDLTMGRLIRADGSYWAQGPGSVIVNYRAGYADESLIPPELKQATMDLVSYYKNEEYKPSMQTRGATITNQVGGSGRDYDTAFPPHIQRILDLYR